MMSHYGSFTIQIHKRNVQLQARDLIMLYVFDVVNSHYFKFGWTERSNPYDRINNGFWTNIHPDELCQKGNPENPEKLSPENLNLIFLFEGDKKLETVVKSLFPPECGESVSYTHLTLPTSDLV